MNKGRVPRGIGISEADLPHIFERFYRADPSRSQVEGTGLGLAIAKWIADTHDARLSAASKEGAGTVFRVVFPVFDQTPAVTVEAVVRTRPLRG